MRPECLLLLISLLSGCIWSEGSSTTNRSQNISFDLGQEQGCVYFTDGNGTVKLYNETDKSIKRIEEIDLVCSTVRVSEVKKWIAVTTTLNDKELHPEIVLFSIESGHPVRMFSVRGSAPCFSKKDGLLYFARAKRKSLQTCFGGGSWVESDLWSLDVEKRAESQLTSERYFLLDSITHYPAKNQILYSSIPFPNGSIAAEKSIRQFDLEHRTVELVAGMPRSYCSDPSISMSGNRMAFVSDVGRHFFYDVLLKDFQTNEAVFPPSYKNWSLFSTTKVWRING